MTPSVLAMALRCAGLGWRVLAVEPQGKRPLVLDRARLAWGDGSTTDPAVIRGWWRRCPSANLGIVVPAGHVVLDVDAKPDEHGHTGRSHFRDLLDEHGPLPTTPAARTGGGGWHVWLRLPPGVEHGNGRGRLPRGIDVRGCERGYLVSPPSVHASGARYAWLEGRAPWEVPVAEVPPWLLVLLAPAEPPPVPRPPPPCPGMRDAVERYAYAALEAECRKVCNAPKGTREATLYAAAAALGSLVEVGALRRSTAAESLLECARVCGFVADDGEAQARRNIVRGLAAGAQRPRDLSTVGCAAVRA